MRKTLMGCVAGAAVLVVAAAPAIAQRGDGGGRGGAGGAPSMGSGGPSGGAQMGGGGGSRMGSGGGAAPRMGNGGSGPRMSNGGSGPRLSGGQGPAMRGDRGQRGPQFSQRGWNNNHMHHGGGHRGHWHGGGWGPGIALGWGGYGYDGGRRRWIRLRRVCLRRPVRNDPGAIRASQWARSVSARGALLLSAACRRQEGLRSAGGPLCYSSCPANSGDLHRGCRELNCHRRSCSTSPLL